MMNSQYRGVTFIVGLLILGGLGIWGYGYFIGGQERGMPGEEIVLETDTENTNTPLEEVPLVVEEVASNLRVPWGGVFTSETRILFTERAGAVRSIEEGKLNPVPLYEFQEVSETGEEGLMGIALDPLYEENRLVYMSLAYEEKGSLFVKVVRLRDTGTALAEVTVLIDRIPAAKYHAGSRVAFGPDGKLYITTGDATDKNIAQDRENLGGKVLRVNPDGSVPNDNPFPGSLVYSFGHRNSQGLAWHPDTKELYATEHGPSIFDGPAGGDEINRIQKGLNYGWPLVSHLEKKEGLEDPLLVFTPAVAPGGAAFYTSNSIPQFQDKLFFAALKGEGLYMLEIDQDNPDTITRYKKLREVNFGRIRDVFEGPDGALYFFTSNTDGRGTPREGDDKLYRLKKAN